MRKLLIPIFLLLILITNCVYRGKTTDDIKIVDFQSGFLFATPITEEEREVVIQVAQSIKTARLKGTLNCPDYQFPLSIPIYLVRDKTKPIPKVCVRPWQCTTEYMGLCDFQTNQEQCRRGFDGLALENLIFILREDLTLSRFKYLLTHEGLHKICNVHHGTQMDIWQTAITQEQGAN